MPSLSTDDPSDPFQGHIRIIGSNSEKIKFERRFSSIVVNSTSE